MSRFLIASWDGGGNTPPAFNLGSRLVRRGHRVRMLGWAPMAYVGAVVSGVHGHPRRAGDHSGACAGDAGRRRHGGAARHAGELHGLRLRAARTPASVAATPSGSWPSVLG